MKLWPKQYSVMLWFLNVWFILQSTLVISKSKVSLKYFEISVPRHFRFAEFRKNKHKQPHLINEHKIWLLKLEIYWKNIVEKWRIAPKVQFLLFSTIFCNLLLDFHVKTEARFSLRDKWLFEIGEIEITIVDCSFVRVSFCDVGSYPSRHTTLKQRRFNVDSTSRHSNLTGIILILFDALGVLWSTSVAFSMYLHTYIIATCISTY